MLILKHGGGFRMLWGYFASDVNMALIKNGLKHKLFQIPISF